MKHYNPGQIVLLVVALLIIANIVGFLLSNPGYVAPIYRWTEPVTDEPFSTEPTGAHGTLIVCGDDYWSLDWRNPEGYSYKHEGVEFIAQRGQCFGA